MQGLVTDTFSLETPTQLTAYLRALRKSQKLTQADLGSRLGVSSARISAIEHNPSAVSIGQLLRVLHALGARMHLDTGRPAGAERRDARPPGTGEW